MGESDSDYDDGMWVQSGKKRTVHTFEERIESLKNHPAFLDHEPTLHEIENNDMLQALQALKYEEDDPKQYAESLKEEGNHFFKLKKYKDAIFSYGEALKLKFQDDELRVILLTNRAASHYYLGNKRKAINDARSALQIKPDHAKAVIRVAQCLFELSYFKDTVEFCDSALTRLPENSNISSLRSQAWEKLKQKQRDDRKQAVRDRKLKKLKDAIKSRGVRMKSELPDDPKAPAPSLDSEGVLSWPVTFFYPAVIECDFIESFNELTTFADHVNEMFREQAPWDSKHSHTPNNLKVFYEDLEEKKPVEIRQELSLKDALAKQSVIEDCHLSYFLVPASETRILHQFPESLAQLKNAFRAKFYNIS